MQCFGGRRYSAPPPPSPQLPQALLVQFPVRSLTPCCPVPNHLDRSSLLQAGPPPKTAQLPPLCACGAACTFNGLHRGKGTIHEEAVARMAKRLCTQIDKTCSSHKWLPSVTRSPTFAPSYSGACPRTLVGPQLQLPSDQICWRTD